MDQNEALEWENYCLPTIFPPKPVIFTKEKVTVSFGDVQCDDLPELHWKDKYKECKLLDKKETLLTQQVETKDSQGWVHLNALNFSKKSKYAGQVKKIFTEPHKVIILDGAIYFLRRDSSLDELKKLVLVKKDGCA